MTMTQEQLEALMRATGTEGYPSDVRRLVEAVQAAERERCAKLCDAQHAEWMEAARLRGGDDGAEVCWAYMAAELAGEIRAGA